jgi:hypothetical protein
MTVTDAVTDADREKADQLVHSAWFTANRPNLSWETFASEVAAALAEVRAFERAAADQLRADVRRLAEEMEGLAEHLRRGGERAATLRAAARLRALHRPRRSHRHVGTDPGLEAAVSGCEHPTGWPHSAEGVGCLHDHPVTAPDARDELRAALAEALASDCDISADDTSRWNLDGLLTVVTAYAEQQARQRAAEELIELAYVMRSPTDRMIARRRANALADEDGAR